MCEYGSFWLGFEIPKYNLIWTICTKEHPNTSNINNIRFYVVFGFWLIWGFNLDRFGFEHSTMFNQSGFKNNVCKIFMIKMYERTIGYTNVFQICRTIYRMKFWLQSQSYWSKISNSKHKGKHFGKQGKLWRLRTCSEERLTKSQSYDQKMHQVLMTLIEISLDGTRFLWKQVLMDTSLWPVLSSSLSCSNRIVCLLQTTCKNKQSFSKTKIMQWVILKEVNDPSGTNKWNCLLEAKYFKHEQSFSKTFYVLAPLQTTSLLFSPI